MNCEREGCRRPVKVVVRRLCNAHYIQLQRTGQLTPLDRFAPQIDKSGECWLWTGYRNQDGYGTFGGLGAHRIAWEREHGPIPAGMTIDHRCRTRACVRVDHLRLMTPSANFSDNGFRDRAACAHGHEWAPANTRVRVRNGRSHRVCRACDRRRQREMQERRRRP